MTYQPKGNDTNIKGHQMKSEQITILIYKGGEMIQCSFCEAIIENTEKLPEGWGRIKLSLNDEEIVNITFCPEHREEAEEKLDLTFLLR